MGGCATAQDALLCLCAAGQPQQPHLLQASRSDHDRLRARSDRRLDGDAGLERERAGDEREHEFARRLCPSRCDSHVSGLLTAHLVFTPADSGNLPALRGSAHCALLLLAACQGAFVCTLEGGVERSGAGEGDMGLGLGTTAAIVVKRHDSRMTHGG